MAENLVNDPTHPPKISTILLTDTLKKRTSNERLLNTPTLYPPISDGSPSSSLSSKSALIHKKNSVPQVTINTSSGKCYKATLTRPICATQKKSDIINSRKLKLEITSAQETAVETERHDKKITRFKEKSEKINENIKLNYKQIMNYSLRKQHFVISQEYNIKVINDLIFDEDTHNVAIFKDFLIYDDTGEFMRRFYTKLETKKRLNNILDYYDKYTQVFPNYFVLKENAFMFKNIERKQKAIDNQQQNKNTEKSKNSTTEKSPRKNMKNSKENIPSRIFTSRIMKEFEADRDFEENDTINVSISRYRSYMRNLPTFENVSTITRKETEGNLIPDIKIPMKDIHKLKLEEILNRIVKNETHAPKILASKGPSPPLRIIKMSPSTSKCDSKILASNMTAAALPLHKYAKKDPPRRIKSEITPLGQLAILPLSTQAHTNSVRHTPNTRNVCSPAFSKRSKSTNNSKILSNKKTENLISSKNNDLNSVYGILPKKPTIPKPIRSECNSPIRESKVIVSLTTKKQVVTPTRNYPSPRVARTMQKLANGRSPSIGTFSQEHENNLQTIKETLTKNRRKMQRATSETGIYKIKEVYGGNNLIGNNLRNKVKKNVRK